MLSDIYKNTYEKIAKFYDPNEAKELAEWLIEHFYAKKRFQYFEDSKPKKEGFEQALERVLNQEPIQYVLSESFFYGQKFFVDNAVLIPRPETELLVEWVVLDQKDNKNSTILDIGTGSGCIAISLKNLIPNSKISALDISEKAINIAKINAKNLKTDVNFILDDILNIRKWDNNCPNIIVSNPPYVQNVEAREMHENVLKHEPHLALFVADEDPLKFYRAIGHFAILNLDRPGFVYFEINQAFGQATKKMLESLGFGQIMIKKDQYGRDRMLRAFLD